MSDEKHTPGPWRVMPGHKNGYPIAIHAPNVSHDEPGAVPIIVRARGLAFPSSSTGQANARLIAAAPEFLEALRRAHRFLFRCEGNGGSTEGQNTTLREECAALLAAIAKATGEDARQ